MENRTGNTPIKRLFNIERLLNLNCEIFVKLEMNNPAGSVKDRIAERIIADAERDGRLSAGGTVVEATSGNAGIGLAYICSLKGYDCKIFMPSTMTAERIEAIKKYGAQVILTDGALGMSGAVAAAREFVGGQKNAFMANQFSNPSNPAAHFDTTGEEIWEQLNGRLDVLVAGVGSGGTISGTARRLKDYDVNIKAIAVEPASSSVLSGNSAGAHKIQGIGAGFIPDNFDKSVVDGIVQVTDEDAYKYCRMLSDVEKIFAGISSGAALAACVQLSADSRFLGKRFVAVLPDSGNRYISTGVFDNV